MYFTHKYSKNSQIPTAIVEFKILKRIEKFKFWNVIIQKKRKKNKLNDADCLWINEFLLYFVYKCERRPSKDATFVVN